MHKDTDTSWGKVAPWYDKLLESDADTYQAKVVLPNLLRQMQIKVGDRVLDLACGQGFFARAYLEAGAVVTGTDISAELIALAKTNAPKATYHEARSDKLTFAKDNSYDKVSIVLALDNIRELEQTLEECARVLVPSGQLYIVINHPAFRIIGESSWGYDNRTHIQYRRLDAYLSESNKKVVMNPGKEKSEATVTFHRPISAYVKALRKTGLYVTDLEEWVSHRKSDKGPRASAENKARQEFPLFLSLVAHKIEK